MELKTIDIPSGIYVAQHWKQAKCLVSLTCRLLSDSGSGLPWKVSDLIYYVEDFIYSMKM